MRYKFYREHKYVSYRLSELERLIAKTNFTVPEEMAKIQEEFKKAKELLEGHAQYENECLHPLLKKKNSEVYKKIENEHHYLEDDLLLLQKKLDAISQAPTSDEQIEAGYHFYLNFRKFVGENLLHLHDEETIILPELQRLYSDEELKQVEAKTYRIMTPQQMIHMLNELFPHMNLSDKEAFLSDIKETEPEKFIIVWNIIKNNLSTFEREHIVKKLDSNF